MNKDEKAKLAKALAVMFNCFPQSAIAEPDLQIRGYIQALDSGDVSAEDALESVERFIRGEVPNYAGQFCPSSAQLCAEARERKKMRLLREQRDNVVSMRKTKLPETHFQNQWPKLKQESE